jgi:hypothetical protein
MLAQSNIRIARAGLARCMTCGGEMTAAPCHGANAELLRHRSLRCLSCGSTERMLVFRQGATEIAVLPPDSSRAPQPEATTSARAWKHAVEKLRSHQADLRSRADDAAKKNWNARFDTAWEQLAPAQRGPPTRGAAPPRRTNETPRRSGKAQRVPLRESPPARSRGQSALPADKPAVETMQRFNRFWESLAAGGHCLDLPTKMPSALPQPLPRSLSLMPVDEIAGLCAAARALSLLRTA